MQTASMRIGRPALRRAGQRGSPVARQTRAAAAPPSGATEPSKSPIQEPIVFGFVDAAERLNSRACMIGFFALIAVEAITNKSFLALLGLTVGQGLGFEF